MYCPEAKPGSSVSSLPSDTPLTRSSWSVRGGSPEAADWKLLSPMPNIALGALSRNVTESANWKSQNWPSPGLRPDVPVPNKPPLVRAPTPSQALLRNGPPSAQQLGAREGLKTLGSVPVQVRAPNPGMPPMRMVRPEIGLTSSKSSIVAPTIAGPSDPKANPVTVVAACAGWTAMRAKNSVLV